MSTHTPLAGELVDDADQTDHLGVLRSASLESAEEEQSVNTHEKYAIHPIWLYFHDGAVETVFRQQQVRHVINARTITAACLFWLIGITIVS